MTKEKSRNMKKFYSFLVAAAMVLGATSCANNDTTEEALPTEGAISFVGELASSRTELGEGNKVMWNANDAIRVYTQENLAGASFAGAATEATATTTFTTTEEFATSNTGYFAVYSDKTYFNENWSNEWSAKDASYDNGVWSVPVKMQGAQWEGLFIPKDSYLEENNFMVAYSENNKLSFKAATAMIKFVHTGKNTWGSFRATGANLAGAATLNYDTATGEISYTLEESDTYIDFEVTEAGQTCYLPIYPGTVSGFELYDDQTLIAKYDGEFTFKPGVIYNMDIENMPALPVVSPYSLLNMADYTRTSMTVEDGCHVAKNVPFSEVGYVVSEGWNQLYSVKTTDYAPVEMNKWLATSIYVEIEQYMTFESDYVDVYMTEDCANICFVPAGAEVPEKPKPQYHIYVYNSSNWSPLNLYVWDAGDTPINGAWPGTALTTTTWIGEGEYFVYDIPTEYNGQTINFIINNGLAQTADLSTVVEGDVYYYTNGTVVEDPENPVIPEAKKLYLIPNTNWKIDNARFAAYFYGSGETWVDMTDADSDGCYECEIPEGYPNVIFCRMNPNETANNWNNKWNQTEDLVVPTDGTNCYTVKEGTWNMGGGTWSTK